MSVQPQLMQNEPSMVLLITVAMTLLAAIAGLVLQAALMRAAVDDLSGKGVSIGAAFATALSLLLPVLGLGILVGLGVAVGMVLLIVPGVMLALRWAVAAPVMVVERLSILKSMGRSAVLTQNHRWAILGLIVFYIVLALVAQTLVLLIVPGSTMAFAGLPGGEGPSIIVILVLSVTSALMSLVATVGGAAVYFELRQIKEGVGVTELAQVFA
jgi:hypothetical protein